TGSLAFDGAGDWLTAPNSKGLYIGSGNFTVEGWLYPTTTGTTRAVVAQFNTNGTGPGWTIYLKTTNVLEFYGGSGTITVTGTGTVSANVWSHFAVVRNGSTITIYVNGTAGGTGTNSSFSDDTTAPVEIGARGGNGSIPFTGYIDDLRITKGYARYTSNFSVPTAAFPNQ
ncbi:MAG: LamG domain-containing protein, partial [Caulobacteraceae bacterium]|nr:LamG domain-containing protein [Caulobacteraceae bacterium]